ncbi:MarR family winged helix-turn-helix transcriptional regulator [Brachyspira hampsonii]|uniref:Helix turn helix multiple antibiotic resistance protein n=2 Tax=Brachyspira hampsonii TaxID=1287055 RepID=A0A2U4FI06_9SPIR|nr:MarR family transcriptional regulator [Brachyspira hampsonii]EKV56841.1 helix turn helix multiple antibiotic resistance protein [Brachyspira hampsonii 30446]MBW5389580.1 MarR family transcriptional regulator [Brachyspira hampsonii]OEJ18988.1 heavy metal transporter [Brachyspira hampsonii]PTY39834.1 heavy metal transporter [Brachyspira hampsonii bv. II]
MKNEDMKKHIEIIYDFWYTSNRFYYLWAKQYGITDLSLFTLFIIYNSKECVQNSITEKLSVPKQTVCSILDNFEKKGYIKKKVNPKDKRNRLISLTKKGITFAEPILKELEKLDIAMLKCLTEDEIKNYVESQKKLITFMNSYFDN